MRPSAVVDERRSRPVLPEPRALSSEPLYERHSAMNSSGRILAPSALFLLIVGSSALPIGAQSGTTIPQSAPATDSQAVANKSEVTRYVSQPVDRGEYILGTGDRVTIRVFGADDLPDRPIEVSSDGQLNAPMLGRVQAAGVSVRAFEADLTRRYRTYFKTPEVFVTVTDYRSQPVTVVGAVNAPGVIQLRRPTRLMEVISQAGGLRPDAGDRVLVTQPVQPDAAPGAAIPNTFTTKEIDLQKIIEGSNPSLNFVIQANDLITIPKAKMVYIVGDVGRPGGYVLDGHSSTLSVLQAIALAGGINKTARAGDSRILRARSDNDNKRVETEINLKKILASKSPDVDLHANDILFVPSSTAKSAGLRSLQMAADIGTGIAIWHF